MLTGQRVVQTVTGSCVHSMHRHKCRWVRGQAHVQKRSVFVAAFAEFVMHTASMIPHFAMISWFIFFQFKKMRFMCCLSLSSEIWYRCNYCPVKKKNNRKSCPMN